MHSGNKLKCLIEYPHNDIVAASCNKSQVANICRSSLIYHAAVKYISMSYEQLKF